MVGLLASALNRAFGDLESWDPPKMHKGLKQIESIMASIALSQHQPARSRRASVANPAVDQEPSSRNIKDISTVTADPAFEEFFRCQESFEYNCAGPVIKALDHLMCDSRDGKHDFIILSAVNVLQGLVFLHPPTKSIFTRPHYMNLLLILLEDDAFPPVVQAATVELLISLLTNMPANTRTLENIDGLLFLTTMFKARWTAKSVKMKLIELIYFYLMPETPSIPSAFASRNDLPALLNRSPSKLAKAFSPRPRRDTGRPMDSDGDKITRTSEEKQKILSSYLNSDKDGVQNDGDDRDDIVQKLVEDLQKRYKPFGGVFNKKGENAEMD
ncbi:putative cell division control protein [Xylariaceae sp. FL1019]|nr:putative cell division control protein [Xylariaceae sp. FL1019]